MERKYQILPYCFERVDNRYLVSNLTRNFIYLTDNEFEELYSEQLSEDLAIRLHDQYFVAFNDDDIDRVVRQYNYIHAGLFKGTFLFIFVLTLECNLKCLYCQAESEQKNCFMSKEIAKRSIDIALKSKEEQLTFEFQGGEPLLNFETLKYIVEYTNANKGKKKIRFSLVTNTQAMNNEILNYLVSHDVNICISIDGPREIHDYNRPTKSSTSNFEIASKWYQIARKEYSRFGKELMVSALPTITRKSLSDPKGIIDMYISLPTSHVSIREISPFGRASKNWDDISYSPEQFIEFYSECMDYIIELTLQGKTTIRESFTEMILCKIIGKMPVNYTDLRSPCGATVGQIAFNWNGRVYTCDEGRMMSNKGIELFCVGDVEKNNYEDFLRSEAACLVCNASCTDTNPNCSHCVYSSICGICPVYNYYTQNDFIGIPFKQDRCKILRGIYKYVIEWINSSDSKKRSICYDWIR